MHPRIAHLENEEKRFQQIMDDNQITSAKISQWMKTMPPKNFKHFHQQKQNQQKAIIEALDHLKIEKIWSNLFVVPLEKHFNDFSMRKIRLPQENQYVEFMIQLQKILEKSIGRLKKNNQPNPHSLIALMNFSEKDIKTFEKDPHAPLLRQREEMALMLLNFEKFPTIKPADKTADYLKKLLRWSTHRLNNAYLAKALLAGDIKSIQEAHDRNTYYPERVENLIDQIFDLDRFGEYQKQREENKAKAQKGLLHEQTPLMTNTLSKRRF